VLDRTLTYNILGTEVYNVIQLCALILQNLSLPQQDSLRFMSCGMWHCIRGSVLLVQEEILSLEEKGTWSSETSWNLAQHSVT